MHFYYISLLIDLVKQEYGIDQSSLLHRTNIAELELDDSLNLTGEQLDSVFSNALDLSTDSQLGLKFGAQINMVPQGILGYALMTSSTVGEALELLARYHRALLPSVNIELKHRDKELILAVNSPLATACLNRFYSEVVYAGVLTAGNMLLGKKRSNANQSFTLLLDYPEPKNNDLYRKVFGKRVKFSQNRNGLYLDKQSLKASISTSNPAAQEVFRKECERLLPHEQTRGEISEQVKMLLISARLEFPTSPEIAGKLHISESTLRRRLKKEGTSFQELLDQVRSKLAHEYLATTQLPVSRIAELLGFSDSANFRRSFKRWANTTPSQARMSSD